MQVIGAVGFMNQRLELPNDLDPQWVSIIESCWHRSFNRFMVICFSAVFIWACDYFFHQQRAKLSANIPRTIGEVQRLAETNAANFSWRYLSNFYKANPLGLTLSSIFFLSVSCFLCQNNSRKRWSIPLLCHLILLQIA